MLLKLILTLATWKTWPAYMNVNPYVAWTHARNAQNASDATFSPELLVAVAFKESRFQRNTYTHVRDKWFCGALAVTATTWKQCKTFMADDALTYRTAVEELHKWRRFCIVKRRERKTSLMRCTLDGYGYGWRRALDGGSYGPSVLRWSRILKKRTSSHAVHNSSQREEVNRAAS